jgi:hypothetical protein
MIADIAIHAPDRRGDDRNHHAHVMLTMRSLTADGFGPKVRAWNDTELLEEWREHWADTVNHHLEQHGLEARVDHRSLADQGIDREPEPKQGPLATKMEREGRTSHAGDDRRAVQDRNAQRAEIATELEAVTAEIIDLDKERSKRAEQAPAIEHLDPDEAEREQGDHKIDFAFLATTSGGMVAQQMEALHRFKRNSQALDKDSQGPAASGEITDESESDRLFREQLNRAFGLDGKGDRTR